MIRSASFGSNIGSLSVLFILAVHFGCGRGAAPPLRAMHSPNEQPAQVAFELKAKLFASGGDIPKEFTCDGPDASPELSWTHPPPGTRSFALIMEEPAVEARIRAYWVVYDVPPTARGIPEAVAARPELVDGSRQAVNAFGRLGYSGPCPAPGTSGRYIFKLFALGSNLRLGGRATKPDVERAMRGHILGQAEITGVYSRPPHAAPR